MKILLTTWPCNQKALASIPIYNLQTRAEFGGKGNKVYYSSDEQEGRESQSVKALSFHF
jgi:hypothetical protein